MHGVDSSLSSANCRVHVHADSSSKDFSPVTWDDRLEEDCRTLIQLAIREDLDRLYDWTTVSLVPKDAQGRASIVARESGIVAGLPAAQLVLLEVDPKLEWESHVEDGQRLTPGDVVATISGSARSLLTAERTMLNLLGRLCGVASLTRKYVDEVAGTSANIYDTRKTTLGWRRLEKYAVRLGGGRNHRTGLFDAVLIKDNHLAWFTQSHGGKAEQLAEAVNQARKFLSEMMPGGGEAVIVEIEVDTLDQLKAVLPAGPDIVLLDNMSTEELQAAVELRSAEAGGVQLEASGGVNLNTVGAIAKTGVDRISVGALTHAAISLDLGLDWEVEP